jgi:hypothetical protein
MNELLPVIASAYGLPSTLEVRHRVEQGYLNTNYVLSANGTRYFLRGYRYTDPAKIEEEHYLKGNTRIDRLLTGRTDGLAYLGENMITFTRRIENSL